MSETPRYEFIGREADLRILTEAWDATATGTPQVVLVRGDSGVGKTRLMQEFFAWLSSHHDKFHYWREIPADRKKALSLVPALADRPVGESPDLPWLWLAARCQEPIHASERVVAFDAVRHQIALHLAGIFQAQRRRAIHTGLAKAAFGFVASFALPGSGAVIEVVNAVLEGGSGTLSGYELYDAIKSKVGATRSESLTLQDVVSREQESIKESALKAFGALFAGTPAPPVVLTIDDAHWVDETTCDVLKAVLGVAGAQHWPLMVVLLSWDEPLRFEDSLVPCPALTAFVAPAHRADGVRFVEHDLTPLHAGQLSRLIQQRLPRLERDGATLLVERSAGDIDLLDDFVEELLHSPGWLDGDGRLAVPVPALLKLPSSATDMARRRLNAAGDEIREALTWASAQGNQFDEAIIRDLLGTMGRVTTLHDSLLQSDSRFGFIKTAAHELLELSGEFRRRLYFDTCRDFFQQHPRGQEFLRQLASALLALAESPVWQALDGAHAQRLGSRLLALVDELNLAGRQWDPTVHAVLGQLAQSRLALGDARGAEHYAQRLVGARTASPAAKEAARKTLIAAAYMEGDIARERSHLDAWHRSRKRSAPYYVLESMYAMRQGASSRSISMARKAQAAARTDRDRLDAAIGLATALWSAGRPEASHKAITEAEHAFGRIDVSRADRISLHHATALALHDLERNMQVVYRANQCVAGYRESGNKQQEIISRVNLGDALWGVGRASEAAAQLETAYAEARATHLPHAEDIAAICFANALREQGKHEAALETIGTGIELAGRIGHLWDKTYGEIYQEAILLERDPAASVARLDRLRDRALDQKYLYLAALAAAIQCVAHTALRPTASPPPTPNELMRFPIFVCHAAAANVLGASALTPDLVEQFLRALGRCEGIKGHRGFVLQALARVEQAGNLSGILRDFARRWRGRFSWNGDTTTVEPSFVTCDYHTCEARCCYDGVYLVGDEEERIRAVVARNPEFFKHLPPEFLTFGEWHGVSGIKTAVHPHDYQAPDFPAHFNRTRCVFAYEDGACSLQAYSMAHAASPFEFKPVSCVMHPLTTTATGVLRPEFAGDDASYLDLDYPGFASFTPCGQPRSDGRSWQAVFAAELDLWRERQSAPPA